MRGWKLFLEVVQRNQIQSGWWNSYLSTNPSFIQVVWYNCSLCYSPYISDRSRIASWKANSAVNSTHDFKHCWLTGHFHCNGRFEMVDWLQRFNFSTQSTQNGQVRHWRNTRPQWKNRTLFLSRNNQLHFWLLQTYRRPNSFSAYWTVVWQTKCEESLRNREILYVLWCPVVL